MEHRWGTRSNVRQGGYVYAPNGLVAPMQIVNVSLSGGLVETEVRLPLFARVQLKLSSLRGRAMLQGQIVRRTDHGFAIEWSHFPDTAVLPLLAGATSIPARAHNPLENSRARRPR